MRHDLSILCFSKKKSVSARRLAKYLDCNLLVPDVYPLIKIRPNTVIFNLGCSTVPIWYHEVLSRGCTFINEPLAVGRAINKLQTQRAFELEKVPCPERVNFHQAYDLAASGEMAIARTKIKASKGIGIVVMDSEGARDGFGDAVQEAPLITAYFKKTHEYRVHVFDEKIISVAEKRAMSPEKLEEMGIVEIDRKVRSYENGWVFAQQDLLMDAAIEKIAVKAVKALGLRFGAVDVLAKWSGKPSSKKRLLKDVKVCEVNTMPSLDGETTFNAYSNLLEEVINS